MKKLFLVIILFGLVACKKDKEDLSQKKLADSTKSVLDSIQIPSFNNPENMAFQITPQNISLEKGKAVFKKNGNVLFYFDQNSNEGNIRIDGKDYVLNRFDFTENNYAISGNGVQIEAVNGDFKDGPNNCIEGGFPEIKVSLNGKTLNLANIEVQDCPNY